MSASLKKLFAELYPKRKPWAHKGEHGSVLIIGGSGRYSGSPALNALAALRSGADLVTIFGAERAMNIAATFAPDLITCSLGNGLAPLHIPLLLKESKKFDSLVVGCGLDRNEKTHQAIADLITKINLPMVVDAEGIRAVAKHPRALRALSRRRAILTPHAEEFRVLTGEVVKPNVADRILKVKRWAKRLGVVILLKGHADVISDGRRVETNATGTPFMTKGGFGDTLSGICGALLARGADPFRAAALAPYINGQAGALASKKYGEGTLASDLITFIPLVLTRFSHAR